MSLTNITGTVVHIRKVSRKLLFFDIILVESDGGEKGGGGETRQTVVFKAWTGPELVDRANRGPDKLHVGDLVHVTGCWEATAAGSPGEFAASNFSVTERWAARHPSESFRPIPPPQSGGTVNVEKVGDVHGGGQLCKFFLNTGRCAAEEGCRFRHHSGDKRSSLVRDRVDYVGARLAARRQRHEAEFPPDTRLCSAARRAEIFGGWIVERFGGAAHLRSGIILDVAGGRGDLSFELAVKLGLNCWTVDPRPQKFRRWQLKMLGAADQNGTNIVTRPVHKQEYFSRDFFAKCGLDPGLVRLVVGRYRYHSE